MNCPIKGLPSERFTVQRAIVVTIEKASHFIFKLKYPLWCSFNQAPGQLLIGNPIATVNRIHEVTFNRITTIQGNVVPTLNHTSTATLAQQAFNGDGYL